MYMPMWKACENIHYKYSSVLTLPNLKTFLKRGIKDIYKKHSENADTATSVTLCKGQER